MKNIQYQNRLSLANIIILSFILFLYNCIAVDQAPAREIPVESKITSVTVFLKGAEIKRKAVKTINPGTTLLVFNGLSPNINPSTVQVKAKGEITILSVLHRLNYLSDEQKPVRVKILEDSLKSIDNKIKINNNYLKALKEEKDMVLSNKSVKGNNIGLDVEELEYTADFFRERLVEIMNNALKTEEKNRKLNEKKSKISQQLLQMNAKWLKSSSEIVVELSSNSKATGRFEISYLVYDASWSPAYDLRAQDVNSPVKLFYKANITQNTGIDWKKIDLTLSTGLPVISGTKPKLQPWVLTFNQPVMTRTPSYDMRNAPRKLEESKLDFAAKGKEEEVPPATTIADYTQVQKNQMNTSFDIKIPYSVPADNKKHLVEIMHVELPAIYRYYAAPKIDESAFLLAHVTGWDDLNLLSGQANLYFANTYIGKSYIEANSTKDTLDLSFGRDPSVVINRKKIKDYTKNKIIGANKKVFIGIEINVRNTKDLPFEMDLQDQIPISSNKDITIELIDKGGSSLQEKTGYLNWRIKMDPKETKTFIFRYTVTYPKNSTIYNF